MAIVRLTIVYDEIEAEMICQVLREEGIECGHRRTNVSAGAWRLLPTIGGQREVFVNDADADAARDVLERLESPAAEGEGD
jgi:Putative prokaryotic signal transducing protein